MAGSGASLAGSETSLAGLRGCGSELTLGCGA